MNNNRHLSDECIVLKHYPINDGDTTISFYGKNLGKFTALAKGLRKEKSKFAAQLQIAHHVEVELLNNHNNYLVVSCSERTSAGKFYKYYNTMLTAFYLCELIETYASEEPTSTDFYSFLKKHLLLLDEKNYIECRLLFEWHFLSLLGYGSTDKDNFMYCFYKYWKTKYLNPFQQSVVDELYAFIRVGMSKNDILLLSQLARKVFRDVLLQEYQKNLVHPAPKSQRILDEETARGYS